MMNEANVTPQTGLESPDRYKNLIVVLTVFTTVFAAALAALQADANIRADIANRDSQYLAVLASGERTRSGLESNYEFNVLGDYLKNSQEASVLELAALEQETNGDNNAARSSRDVASIAQARADAGEKFSILYTDSRYTPQSENDMPKADQYVVDVFKKSNEISNQQNEASNAYVEWNHKADSYVTSLTVLVVAFFLFGLAQALKDGRTRLIFTVFGVIVIAFSLLITVTTFIL